MLTLEVGDIWKRIYVNNPEGKHWLILKTWASETGNNSVYVQYLCLETGEEDVHYMAVTDLTGSPYFKKVG